MRLSEVEIPGPLRKRVCGGIVNRGVSGWIARVEALKTRSKTFTPLNDIAIKGKAVEIIGSVGVIVVVVTRHT